MVLGGRGLVSLTVCCVSELPVSSPERHYYMLVDRPCRVGETVCRFSLRRLGRHASGHEVALRVVQAPLAPAREVVDRL
jgi:hypothetical protein